MGAQRRPVCKGVLICALVLAATAAPAQASTNIGGGLLHSCAIDADSKVRCWGWGWALGYAGRGDDPDDDAFLPSGRIVGDDEPAGGGGPVDIGDDDTVKAIAVGYHHTCAIRNQDDTVVCWGRAENGRLGYGNLSPIGDDEAPGELSVDLGTPDTAKAITAGVDHTCVLRSDNKVICWGQDDYGVTGHDAIGDIGDGETPGSLGAVQLASTGPDTAKAISAGGAHTCAIRTDDTVVCWGWNFYGQLGYGHETTVSNPGIWPATSITVDLGATDTAKSISAAGSHTCAIRTDNTVVCWGFGFYGGLGYGSQADIGDDEPPGTRVVDLGAVDTAKAIVTGHGSGSETCAIRTDDTAVCWGNTTVYGPAANGYAQLIGDNETPGTRVVDVGAVDTVTAIGIGSLHACAVRTNATITCWGLSYGANRGDGGNEAYVFIPGERITSLSAGTPTSGVPAALSPSTTTTAGARHTCAIRTDQTIACWGDGGDLRLGYGSTDDIGDDEATGARVVDIGASDLAKAIDAGGENANISTHEGHTCAIRENDTVVCWGAGGCCPGGSLGYGPAGLIPFGQAPGERVVDLGATDTATAVTTGGEHSCAIRSGGTVVCWGTASSGQLGYGNTNKIGDNETPGDLIVDLGATDTATAITTGFEHTCAIRSAGTVVCWGFGSLGRLGYGNTLPIGNDETPGELSVDLGAGDTAKAIAAGGTHTCAIRSDDTVVCWGAGANGRLGRAATENIGDGEAVGASVVDLGVVDTAKAIAAGGRHTCALRTDDTLVCWGSGATGQLGYGNLLDIGDDEPPGALVVPLAATPTALNVSAGQDHTCAVRATDGAPACWGLGIDGQLGLASRRTIGDDDTPGAIGAPPPPPPPPVTPPPPPPPPPPVTPPPPPPPAVDPPPTTPADPTPSAAVQGQTPTTTAPSAGTNAEVLNQALAGLPSTRKCVSRRNFRIRLRHPRGTRILAAVVKLNTRTVATRRGARITAAIDMRGLPKGRFTVRISLILVDGRAIVGTRRYRTCAPKRDARD